MVDIYDIIETSFNWKKQHCKLHGYMTGNSQSYRLNIVSFVYFIRLPILLMVGSEQSLKVFKPKVTQALWFKMTEDNFNSMQGESGLREKTKKTRILF